MSFTHKSFYVLSILALGFCFQFLSPSNATMKNTRSMPTSNPSHQQNKPTVLILTTGGTIAGSTSHQNIEYKAGQTSGQSLIDSVPALKNIASIQVESIAQVGSQDMSDAILRHLALHIQQAEQDPSISGIVITHGTDTMEETAFFLNEVTQPTKPIILTGAMRPPGLTSADGASNLINAVELAIQPEAQNRPVMVMMNDTIFAARSVQKMHTTSLQTFQAPNSGPIGTINNHHINFFYPPFIKTTSPYSIPDQTPFPRVDIIYSHIQMDGDLIHDAIKRGVKGIVLAGVGDGNTSNAALQALKQASDQGIVIVRSSRVGSGFVNRNVEINDDINHFIAASDLNPQKARILLQLLLANHIHEHSAIQKAFTQLN